MQLVNKFQIGLQLRAHALLPIHLLHAPPACLLLRMLSYIPVLLGVSVIK